MGVLITPMILTLALLSLLSALAVKLSSTVGVCGFFFVVWLFLFVWGVFFCELVIGLLTS